MDGLDGLTVYCNCYMSGCDSSLPCSIIVVLWWSNTFEVTEILHDHVYAADNGEWFISKDTTGVHDLYHREYVGQNTPYKYKLFTNDREVLTIGVYIFENEPQGARAWFLLRMCFVHVRAGVGAHMLRR